MRTFLGNLTRQHRHVLIPYHLPAHKPREDAPERFMTFLWNHKKNITGAGRRWEPTACSCDQLLRLHPQLQHQDGHISTGLELFKFPHRLQHLTQCGAANAVFPTKKELCTSTVKSSAVGCDIISSPRTNASSTSSWTSCNSNGNNTPQHYDISHGCGNETSNRSSPSSPTTTSSTTKRTQKTLKKGKERKRKEKKKL